jgi:hypothetical protein
MSGYKEWIVFAVGLLIVVVIFLGIGKNLDDSIGGKK